MLFKYLPIERVDILENLKIRFSPLMSLNDPFECQPLVDMKNESSQFLEQMLSDLDELWENTDNEEKTEENRKTLEETRAGLIADVKEKTNSFVVGQELIARLSDNLGLLSLSRTEDNLLMWSHYAGEGKGIVGFYPVTADTFEKRHNVPKECSCPNAEDTAPNSSAKPSRYLASQVPIAARWP